MENKRARTAAENVTADKKHNPPPSHSENPIEEATLAGAISTFADVRPEDADLIEAGFHCTACGGSLRWIPRISRFALLPHYRCTNCAAVMVAEEITEDPSCKNIPCFEIRPCECTREHVAS
jgi:hypothetical protein